MKELSSGRVGWSGGIPNIPGIPVSLMVKLQDLFKQEFAHSLNTAMMVSVFICVAGALVALLVRSHVSQQNKPAQAV